MPTKKPKIEQLSDTRPPIEELSDSRPGIEELSDQPPQEDMSLFDKALGLYDTTGSVFRTAAEAALNPEKEVIPELQKQFGNIIESPFTAGRKAPTGPEVNVQLSRQLGLTRTPEEEEALKQEFPTASKIMEPLAGFVTETVLDPNVISGFVPKIKRIINTPIVNMADKQAAKIIARATPKSALATGKDIEKMSKRLVAEDLHGLLTNPTKVYESLAGSKYEKKIMPDSLNTLRLETTPKTKGLISEVASGVDDTLKELENAVPELKNKTYPLDAAFTVIKNNIETNEDLISGQTIDMSKVGEILQEVLKPFKQVSTGATTQDIVRKTPGTLELAEGVKMIPGKAKAVPNTLSLSQVQQLRKNIGRLLSDRTFYATPDKAMNTEKEVLKELHGVLGDMIYNDLKGIQIRKGKQVLDAGQYYNDQNDRLKQLMDLRSIFQFSEKEKLSKADMIGTLMSLTAQGGVLGSAAIAGDMLGVPYSSTAGLVGAGLTMAGTAGSEVKKAAPEYLSKILSTAAKVSPAVYAAPVRGTIQYMREGKPVGREPQSIVELTPKELINYKIPRNTEAMIQSKGTVIAKLAQSGIPEDMLKAVNQALNGDKETLSNVASLVSTQFPDLFEKSKYKVFDGRFLDANDAAKAADDISRRDDLNSIQRAKMINQINKHQTVPEGL